MIENSNSLVVISLSKVGEKEFLQTLQPIYKVESSFCHHLEMLKIRKNERNDLYIFSRVVTYESLPVSVQSFKKILQHHLEKSAGEAMIQQTFQFWSGEEMLVKKLGVNALLPMLCRLRFSKSFQSDNHIYCDLNNSTLAYFVLFYRNRF